MAEYYHRYSCGEDKLQQGYHQNLGLEQAACAISECRSAAVDANTSITSEFNPRSGDDPAVGAGGAYNRRLPPQLHTDDEDMKANADPSTVVAAPAWWASPSSRSPHGDPPTTTHEACGYPQMGNPFYAGEAVAPITAVAPPSVDRFPCEPRIRSMINNNNPYLTPAGMPGLPNRATSTWHAQRLQDYDHQPSAHAPLHQPSPVSHYTDEMLHSQRGVFLPVFSNQQPHGAAYGSYPSNAINNVSQFSVLNQPRETSPMRRNYPTIYGDGYKSSEDDLQGWPRAHPGRLSVGKSQSMRALYEENAALRRALHSIQRGSAVFDTNLPALENQHGPLGEPNPCIASDVAEGRTLSMRERGRWAMHAGDGSCPIWVGTPGRRRWAGGAPVGNMRVAAGTASQQGPRRRYSSQGQWHWDEEYEHSYAGGCWPESEPVYWEYMQHEMPAEGDEDGGNEGRQGGTSLKQLLGGGPEKRRGEEGRKKGADEKEKGLQYKCAMCGGRLRRKATGGGGKAGEKSGGAAGLPLRLCPACHPRAVPAAPPLSATHRQRHNVATALLMACRPTPHHHHGLSDSPPAATQPASKKTGGRSRRINILHLCRHFVGLSSSSKLEPPSPPSET